MPRELINFIFDLMKNSPPLSASIFASHPSLEKYKTLLRKNLRTHDPIIKCTLKSFLKAWGLQ